MEDEQTRYRTILIDPPWKEAGGGRIKRGADRHYPVLTTNKIIQVIGESDCFRPEPLGCHLYLWVTNNHLEDGLSVIRQLGFRYVTNLVWVKDRFGLGRYFRGQHELCLFSVMGRLMTLNRRTSTVLAEKKREHSRKPEMMYSIIENCSPPPRLEMFARRRREGWSSWGNEV